MPSFPFTRTWKECAPRESEETRIPFFKTSSIDEEKFPSVAKRTVAFPVPGSVSQKYSAWLTFMFRVTKVGVASMKIVCLKSVLHEPSKPCTRTWNECAPSDKEETAIPFLNNSSMVDE